MCPLCRISVSPSGYNKRLFRGLGSPSTGFGVARGVWVADSSPFLSLISPAFRSGNYFGPLPLRLERESGPQSAAKMNEVPLLPAARGINFYLLGTVGEVMPLSHLPRVGQNFLGFLVLSTQNAAWHKKLQNHLLLRAHHPLQQDSQACLHQSKIFVCQSVSESGNKTQYEKRRKAEPATMFPQRRRRRRRQRSSGGRRVT